MENNPHLQPARTARRSRAALLALGGCAGLIVCVVLACALNALYWTVRIGSAGAAPALAEVEAGLEQLPPGDAARGQDAFTGSGGCFACHSLEPGVRVVGPSLAGVSARAATREPGRSADQYLYESIVAPNAYVVEGFPSGVMPGDFAKALSPQELADLIDFLKTQ